MISRNIIFSAEGFSFAFSTRLYQLFQAKISTISFHFLGLFSLEAQLLRADYIERTPPIFLIYRHQK